MSDIATPIAPALASQEAYQGIAYLYGVEGEMVLPPFWDDAMVRFSGGNSLRYVDAAEFVMRRMMRDPILQSHFRVFRALICEGEHRIMGRVEDPKTRRGKEAQRFKRSEEVRDFTQKWVDGLYRPLARVVGHLCEAFPYGNKLCEVEAEVVDGKVVPIDLSPKPRTAYRYVVTKANKVLGARPEVQAETDLVPPANLLYLSVSGMDDDPNGEPALASAYDPWYRKGNFLRDEVKASAQAGGSSLMVNQEYPPAGVAYSPFTKVKQTDGSIEEVATSRLAAQEAAKIRTGAVAVLPPGYKASFLTANDSHFGEKIDRCDREMVLALIGATRMTMEAQNGSRADSDTAEGVVMSIRDWARGLIAEAVERLFAVYVKLNFPPEYWEFVPRYDIVTEEPGDVAAISNFLSGNFDRLTLEQKNFFMSKLGAPLFPDEDETQAIDREEQAQAEEEEAQFAIRFSNTVEFASRLEIANEAAQKRVSRAVRSADRQFRNLVTRLASGRISEDEFRDRFAYTLAVGHERAFRFGFSHGGGGDELTPEAENYIAEAQAVQADYMIGLAEALASGDISEAEGLRRARMYAQRIRGTANEAFRQASLQGGHTLTWEIGGTEDHCEECPQYAAMSPWQPDELFATPGSGDTPCITNCKCRLVRSDGRTGFAPVELA